MDRLFLRAICLFAAAAPGAPALAEDGPPFVTAPAASQPAPVSLAVSYELEFRLTSDMTIAELLLQTGVNPDDATAADKLSAGHDGGSSGCFVRIAITKPLGATEYRLQRLTLITASIQTVMERRSGALAISSSGNPDKRLHTLV